MFTLQNIHKQYGLDQTVVQAVQGASFTVKEGESLAIMGASGCGKSTLLSIAGLLETPERGDILFEGKNLETLSDQQRTRFRRDTLGFVFQKFHLVPVFDPLENVLLPGQLQGRARAELLTTAQSLLKAVGLEASIHRPVKYLSGGERQRVAVARALINRPRVVLADEPTANLDQHSGEKVLELLFSLSKTHGTSLVIVTHAPNIARLATRCMEMRDGQLRALSTPS